MLRAIRVDPLLGRYKSLSAAWSVLSLTVFSNNDSVLLHCSDVRGGLPGELNIIFNLLSTLGLCVDTLNDVTVAEVPLTFTLGLVVIKLTLKVSAVGVAPFTRDHLAA